MPEKTNSAQNIAQQVSAALNGADLSAFAELLDPNVHWGPPGVSPATCQNRNQVIAWYEQARKSGRRAQVTEIEVMGDRILVEMLVSDNRAGQDGGAARRWQVLTVANGRIVDIVGFDERGLAVARAKEET